MTPQGKAQELFNKMLGQCASDNGEQATILSKQCALIAADEFLLAYERFPLHPQYIYWTEVKEEINKL